MRSSRTLSKWTAGCVLALTSLAATAQEYPSKPIRLVIPFAVGGATDLIGRLIAQELGRQLGQPVIVENKAGAAGAIAADFVAKAPADGYTLCFCTTGAQVMLQYLTKLPFDPVADLKPVIHVHNVPNVLLARTELPANTVPELIGLAKQKPGGLSFASTGSGGPQHLAGELFQALTGTSMIHVPYKGESPAFTDLAGGQVDTAYGSISVAEPLIKAGRIKAIAVTGAERSPAMPNVPTAAESVPGFIAYSFVGINVPAQTAPVIVEKLNHVLNRVLATPAVREKMVAQVVEPVGGTVQAYADFLDSERKKWSEVIKRAHVKLD